MPYVINVPHSVHALQDDKKYTISPKKIDETLMRVQDN